VLIFGTRNAQLQHQPASRAQAGSRRNVSPVTILVQTEVDTEVRLDLSDGVRTCLKICE